jgi:hypothetical protein
MIDFVSVTEFSSSFGFGVELLDSGPTRSLLAGRHWGVGITPGEVVSATIARKRLGIVLTSWLTRTRPSCAAARLKESRRTAPGTRKWEELEQKGQAPSEELQKKVDLARSRLFAERA